MRGGGAAGLAGFAEAADTGTAGGVGGAAGGAAACTGASAGALCGGMGVAGGRAGAETDGVVAAGVAGGLTAGGAGGAAGGAGGLITGRATLCGVMNRGAGVGGAGGVAGRGAGGVTVAAAGGATAAGFVSTGGVAGRTGGGAAAAAVGVCCCLAICFNTSPGLEMCERSILVLISSASRPVRWERDGDACASLAARKWARTFSASCSSTELECVFFSVTPTATRTSRIALLLTSSSLARSLIRILLIRPFFAPHRS